MERNAGYEIKRLLLYDDNKGFALKICGPPIPM